MKNLFISLVLVFTCVFSAFAQIDDPNVMSVATKFTDKFGDKIPNTWVYKVAFNAKFSNSATASSNAVIVFYYSSLKYAVFELHEYSTLSRFREDTQDTEYSVIVSIQNGGTYEFSYGAVSVRESSFYGYVEFFKMIDDLSKLKQGTKIAIEMVERDGYGTPTEANAVVKYDKDFASFISKVKAKLVNDALYKEYKNPTPYKLSAEEERVIRAEFANRHLEVSKIVGKSSYRASVIDTEGNSWDVYFSSTIDGVEVTSIQ